MPIFPVLNQRLYPKAGDVDDCFVVATCWAAKCVAPYLRLPDVTEFRAAAGDPDDGVSDGGSLDEIVKASRALWPQLPLTVYNGDNWQTFLDHVKRGGIASLAVISRLLPVEMRWGFLGAHQVGVAFTGGNFYLMNPLAPDGSPPVVIGSAQLRTAAFGLFAENGFRGVVLESVDMKVTAVVREAWKPTVNASGASNGVFRAIPDRAAPVVDRVPIGARIVTIAEIQTDAYSGARSNGDWRLVDAGREPRFVLRSDLDSLGPDPVVSQAAIDAARKQARGAALEEARAKATFAVGTAIDAIAR